MQTKTKRIIELDILRGFSILGVILIHIIGGSLHFWSPGSAMWNVFIATDQFFRFSVPLFVFISGYTLYSKYKNNFKYRQFYAKRVARILPWYAIWSLIIYIYINLTVKPGYVNYPLWKLIFLGKVDYHLYFVSMIIQLYIIFPLLLWLFAKFKSKFVFFLFFLEAAVYTIFTLDGQKIIQLPWRFYEQQQYLFFGTWIFYFVLGFAIAQKSLLIKKVSSPIKTLFLIATVVLLTYSIFDSLHLILKTVDTNVATRSTRLPILFYSTSFAVSAMLYSNLLLKLKKIVLRALVYFANISFLVYLIHALVIRIIGNFILPSSAPNLIIFTILVFSFSILLAQLSLMIGSIITRVFAH